MAFAVDICKYECICECVCVCGNMLLLFFYTERHVYMYPSFSNDTSVYASLSVCEQGRPAPASK